MIWCNDPAHEAERSGARRNLRCWDCGERMEPDTRYSVPRYRCADCGLSAPTLIALRHNARTVAE